MTNLEITACGWVATAPRLSHDENDEAVSTLRIATTNEVLLADGSTKAENTEWLTVHLPANHHDNLAASIRKGQPVIVAGQLRSRVTYLEHGATVHDIIIKAATIGHDLTKGVALFALNPPLN